MKKKWIISLMTLACSGLSTSFTWAATATGNLSVSATILSTCVVGTSTLNFGNYDPTAPASTTATGSVVVTCTGGVPYTIALGAGQTGGTVTTRRMEETGPGTSSLDYFINRSNCGTALCDNWGETNGTDTVNSTGTGAAQSIPAYGVIPANQSGVAGVYSDVVQITVTFPFT